jgi:hypothetical protein
MMMALYLYLLVVLVTLACCWRTMMVLSLVAVAANVTLYTNVTQR